SGGSYTQAIAKFDAFLESFPDNEHASKVRVDRGMAQMRQAVDAGRNWPQTLETAKQIIGEISSEKDFKEARNELAALLPAIAEGLADQAREKLDPALVEQAHETEKLVGKYVSKELMPTQRMADVGASLALTEHLLGRDAALEETLKNIQQAIADGTPQVAYAQRKQLLKMYSDLSTNERLQQAVQSLSAAVRGQTRYVAEPKQAAKADAASPVEADVVLANRSKVGEAPGMAGEVTYALAGGAAYAIQADNGTVLWRRFVGFDVDFLPRPVALDPASDVILVDAKRQQLLRVAAKSGELRWRSEIGEPFDAHPVIARNQVWLATRSGRLAVLDLETGDASGYLQIPQGLRVGPAFDSRGETLYQLGENSNLYVVAAQTNECREVLYLGHEPESVRVPPVAVHPYLFIAENNSASDSVLHVLKTDDKGLNVRPAHASLPLAGHVLAPPVVAGRNLVVATDRGAIYSFEINAPDPGPPLTKVAESPAEDAAPFVRYPLLKDAQLWVAGGGLTKFDIHAARGRLEPKWIQDEGDMFVGPPTVRGDVVFHARRKKNLPEILVSAIHAGDGARIWETQLAAPPAGAPMTGQREGAMTVVDAAGSLFEVPSLNLNGRSVQDKALAAMSLDRPLVEGAVPALLADGGLAIGAAEGQPKALIADGAANRALHWLSLPDPLGAAPIGFAGGLLAPGKLGQVFVLDPATGRQLIAAFQPRLQSGETFAWSNPVRLGENEVLLADGRNSLYRLGIADKPQPHLVALATAELPGPVAAPVVALAKTVYAVDGAGQLRTYSLPDLKPGPVSPLGGAQWGPARAADRVLVLTHGGELACFDESRQQLWKVAWPHGSLAGAPLAGKDGYLLATVSGTVFRMAADSGQELGKCDVGEPLGAGPVVIGDRLCLAAHGGALLLVACP
ncbi:MAG TPA: PQQ-binding-like beta-propeller repeat protein, partial [Pirellulales bacterium]|nr:PQQ-binding-like beta-propeller repeat protein [Pirellulales bacterium]